MKTPARGRKQAIGHIPRQRVILVTQSRIQERPSEAVRKQKAREQGHGQRPMYKWTQRHYRGENLVNFLELILGLILLITFMCVPSMLLAEGLPFPARAGNEKKQTPLQ